MRQFSKMQKFFLICAAVLVAGIICCVAGIAANGIEDMNKLSEKYEWFNLNTAGEGERGVTAQPVDDFHAINIDADADVYLLGEEFYKNASRLVSDEILNATETDVLGNNQVIVIAGDAVPQPLIEVNEGVLTISNSPDAEDVPWTPTVLICCPPEMLESLQINSDYSDLKCLGTAWKNAAITVASGDITMEGVTSGGLSLQTDSGDAELQGEFQKTTSIRAASGDISMDTSFAKAEYALDLQTASGDITVYEPGTDPAEYGDGSGHVAQTGGPHKLTVNIDSGDLELSFGGAKSL